MSTPTSVSPLAQWLSYLETLHPTAIDMGLARITEVAKRLNLQLPCVRITVGGTNGKGSTCAMLEAIYLAAGYKVGTYTSPHLVRYNERIRLNGEQADDASIVEQFARIDAARGDITLSYFEFSTLAAILLFEARGVDVAILEVGLGGRLDAVNIIDADCAIVTSVDIDHQQYLGSDREQIGWEKAHIFRRGRPAICSDPMPPQRLIDYAAGIGADLWLFGRDFNYSGDRLQWAYGGRSQRRASLAYPALRGANQLLNASAALAAIEALRSSLAVPQQAVRVGLSRVELPGRMDILPGLPAIVLDVAHNPHAAAALGQSLDAMQSYPATHAVVGMYADKDVEGVIRRMATRIDHWYCAGLEGERGLSAEKLAQIVRRVTGNGTPASASASATANDGMAPIVLPPQAQPAESSGPGVKPAARPVAQRRTVTVSEWPDPVEAFRAARKAASDNDRIVVFGSFSTVGPVLADLGREGV
ncbi:bifunctional tetrahydrofolate synthase/dihydrofolate synthase [Yanghanlia caeni]|uniref:Dihydrofolate synthase/folylpolyglutamate synthase n=1 Tax=Yanghanlia caeni TaxID=3064283 RepID=A0ABU1D7R6_9BURK|nr:bifunctional tetrahydrofolate synthase/dihydrofolate synthase [Alcaligenaceae bacterium LG-2]